MDIPKEVLRTLRKITRGIDLHSQQLVKSHGLTGPQLLVLKELSENPSITPSQLARRLSISQATITTMLDRLAKNGHLKRFRDTADKRKVHIELQEKGLDILERSPSVLQEDFVRTFSNLPDWQQTQILSSLQRVAQLMNAQNIQVSPHIGVDDRYDGTKIP
ncbi:MAG: MarR family transcriptional regulator [Spirochaetales bacterium]|nr:MarR family transcriptional regulator [Spirochaetales bacterium]